MTVITSVAISALMLGLAFGLWLGAHLKDNYWRDAGREEVRVYSRGELFHVICEGDFSKAQRVLRDIAGSEKPCRS